MLTFFISIRRIVNIIFEPQKNNVTLVKVKSLYWIMCPVSVLTTYRYVRPGQKARIRGYTGISCSSALFDIISIM